LPNIISWNRAYWGSEASTECIEALKWNSNNPVFENIILSLCRAHWGSEAATECQSEWWGWHPDHCTAGLWQLWESVQWVVEGSRSGSEDGELLIIRSDHQMCFLVSPEMISS
jgi:hypothetical protein